MQIGQFIWLKNDTVYVFMEHLPSSQITNATVIFIHSTL